jgi:hypothetical protein
MKNILMLCALMFSTVVLADSSIIPSPFSLPTVEFQSAGSEQYKPASVTWYFDAGRTPSAPIVVTLPSRANITNLRFTLNAISRAGHILFLNASVLAHASHLPVPLKAQEGRLLGPYEKKIMTADLSLAELMQLQQQAQTSLMFYLDESPQQHAGTVRPKFNRRGLHYSVRFEE